VHYNTKEEALKLLTALNELSDAKKKRPT